MKNFLEFLSEDRIDFKTFNLKALYSLLNSKYFNGALPEDLPVAFKKMKRRGGEAQAMSIRDTAGRKIYKQGTAKIFIAARFFEQDKLTAILLHEMIHVYLFINGDFVTSHGGEFERMRRDLSHKSGIEIPVTEDDAHEDEFPDDDKSYGFLIFIYAKRVDCVIIPEKLALSNGLEFKQKIERLIEMNHFQHDLDLVQLMIAKSYISQRHTVNRSFDVFALRRAKFFSLTNKDYSSFKDKRTLFVIDVKKQYS